MYADRLSLHRRRGALRSLKRKDTTGIILLGDSKVGKTSLIEQWLNNVFNAKYEPTIEHFYSRERTIRDRNINIGLVDIAGSSQFPVMDELFIKKSDSIIFVYEIGDEKSIKSIERYYRNVKQLIGEKPVLMTVAGTKCDKYEENGTTHNFEIGKEYFSELKTLPKQFLTSAKNQIGVNDLFDHVVGKAVSLLFPGDDAVEAILRGEVEDDTNMKRQKKHCCTIS